MNLTAELTRYGYNCTDVAKVLGCSDNMASDKISGKLEFTFQEAMTLRKEMFPGMKLEYLFELL